MSAIRKAPIQNLQGIVAVVTGAASGIGLAMAERFAAAGMKLALSETLFENLRNAGSEVGVSALCPTIVADAVYDAVLEKKLYILTHEVTRAFVEKRTRHIVEGTNPTPPGEVLGDLRGAD